MKILNVFPLLLISILLSLPAQAGYESGTANQVLRVPSGGGRPKYGQVNLSALTAVTGALPIAHGGSGNTAGVVGTSRVMGAFCKNNAATPNTQYDLDADSVVLRNSSNEIVVRHNPGAAITNNVLTAGPAANGRDQAAAFTVSTFVHFYWIWNGTTLSTISSSAEPTTGPTLPATYTHWAYAGPVRFNASSQLIATFIRGATVFLQGGVEILTSTTAGSQVTASLSTVVPTNALSYKFYWNGTITSSAASDISIAISFRSVSGVDAFKTTATWEGQSASATGQSLGAAAEVELPYNDGNMYYQLTVSAGSSPSIGTVLLSYKIPNGGE